MLMKTDTLQDSLDKYRAKIAGSARNRAAAYELALAAAAITSPATKSVTISSHPEKVPAYEAAKLPATSTRKIAMKTLITTWPSSMSS